MPDKRRIEVAAGLLFFVSTASYLVGDQLIRAAVKVPDYEFGTLTSRLTTGLLLEIVNAIAVVGIAVLLFLLLRKTSPRLSLGYLISRLLEAGLLIASAIGALVSIHWYETNFQLAMLVLGAGSLLLCFALYRTRLVPRSLSVLGIVGYTALFISGLLGISGHTIAALFIPGAIFEIIFPLWLIVRGMREQAPKPKRVN